LEAINGLFVDCYSNCPGAFDLSVDKYYQAIWGTAFVVDPLKEQTFKSVFKTMFASKETLCKRLPVLNLQKGDQEDTFKGVFPLMDYYERSSSIWEFVKKLPVTNHSS